MVRPASMTPDVGRSGRAGVDAPSGRAVLAIACTVALMTVLDISVVTVALPAMQADLGLGASALPWVVNAYGLTLAGFLLLGGRAADLYGTERVFVAGLVIFTTASLAGGLAVEGWQLIAARAVQGVGGAVLAPVTLTLLAQTFREPGDRARALGLWAAVAGVGGALGGVAGGLLTGFLGWRWVLIVNVPIGAVLVAGSFAVLSVRRRPDRSARLDLPGAIAVTLACAALVAGIGTGAAAGWAAPTTLVLLATAVGAGGLFIVVERRAPAPLVPLEVFRVPSLLLADGISLLTGGLVGATFYFLSLHLQHVRGFDAQTTGLLLLPGAVGITLGARCASPAIARFGPRTVYLGGSVLATGGLLWLSAVQANGHLVLQVLVPSFLAMAGCGLSGLPITLAAMADVPHHQAGLASGLLNVSRHTGGAVLLATLVAVATARGADPVAGQSAAFVVCGVIAAVAGVLGTRLSDPRCLSGRSDPRR